MSERMQFTAIDLKTLTADLPPLFDLYIRLDGKHVLYRKASKPLNAADRRRLLAGGVSTLWFGIPAHENAINRLDFGNILTLSDDELPAVVKGGLLYSSAMTAIRNSFGDSVSPPVLTDLQEVIALTIDYLILSEQAFPSLLKLMVHDANVYTHTLNVAVYALALGKFSGITDRRALCDLGVGAILHDVGKAKVPESVLQKPGPLSSEEWKIIRHHPLWGTEMLSQAANLPDTTLQIVLQHHERRDGSGYPYGLDGEGIHPLAKLVALVDAYEAITGFRVYRQSLPPFEALVLLKKDTPDKLDGDLFENLVRLLGSIPRPGLTSTTDDPPSELSLALDKIA